MSIVYERTFEIEYNDCKITDEQKNILAEKLQANDIIAHSYWNDDYYELTYGEYEHTEETIMYQIIDENENVIFEYDYSHIVNDVYKQLSRFYPNLETSNETTQTTQTKMKSIDGSRLKFDDGLIDADYENSFSYNYVYNGEDVHMLVSFSGASYNNIRLKFKITWEADRVKRADVIENKLISVPLADMGVMQRLFENSLNDMGYWTEDATVHCFFETKTETKSECSPDIVKMVRDARNKEEEE